MVPLVQIFIYFSYDSLPYSISLHVLIPDASRTTVHPALVFDTTTFSGEITLADATTPTSEQASALNVVSI